MPLTVRDLEAMQMHGSRFAASADIVNLTMKAYRHQFAGLDTQLSQMVRSFASLDTQVKPQLASLSTQMARSFAGLDTQLSQMARSMATLNSQLGPQLASLATQMTRSFAGLDSQVSQLARSFATLETQLKPQLASLATQMTRSYAGLDSQLGLMARSFAAANSMAPAFKEFRRQSQAMAAGLAVATAPAWPASGSAPQRGALPTAPSIDWSTLALLMLDALLLTVILALSIALFEEEKESAPAEALAGIISLLGLWYFEIHREIWKKRG